jgi:hypothetical protein
MNYNIWAYIIYLALMIFIIVYVGRYFFTNGRVFIISLLDGNVPLADRINRLLLIAYYLFNIGYACIKLSHWQKIISSESLFASLSVNMGTLILILGVTHYLNLLLLYYLSKFKSISITNKTFPL